MAEQVMTWADGARATGRSIPWLKARAESGELRTITQAGREYLDPASVERLAGSGGGDDEAAAPRLGDIARACAMTVLNQPGPAATRAVARSMNAISGPAGGFLVPYQIADSFVDHARSLDGPMARCRFWRTRRKQFGIPYFDETSRVANSRWGGVGSYGGLSEVASLAGLTSQPTIGLANFDLNPILVYTTPMSNDLLADSDLLEEMLTYSGRQELRYKLEGLMISGDGTGKPLGVINSPATIAVAAEGGQSAATINITNIDKMWARCWGPSKKNAVWLCNDETFQAIDSLAVTEGWPLAVYVPQGVGGNAYPLLKGRPLISQEQCPVLGQPGDLLLADWSQTALAVHRFASGFAEENGQGQDRPMEISFVNIDEMTEVTSASHPFFDSDQTAFKLKVRADFKPLWRTPITPANGASTLSPFVVIATR